MLVAGILSIITSELAVPNPTQNQVQPLDLDVL